MTNTHWGLILVALIGGYALGRFFPQLSHSIGGP